MSDQNKLPYPSTKTRELSESEKDSIRAQIEAGDADVHKLATDFDCSPSQIAGIKAALKK